MRGIIKSIKIKNINIHYYYNYIIILLNNYLFSKINITNIIIQNKKKTLVNETPNGYNFNNNNNNNNKNKIYKIINKYIKVIRDSKLSKHFKAWFSGFVSGDGSLFITPNNLGCINILLKKKWMKNFSFNKLTF
uniref:Homing endonuclease LAGLIDADG domain-containing protein n=1 Tax=Barnettozyma californica TaxID=36038 RepID=S5TEG6_9ASCO|nr:hypothetical protein [Barnettozyma californica]AGS44249.1 hypothetical protein [Barnettozyma californica]